MMDLQQIETLLDSPNPQFRMRGITQLRHYEPDVVVPLLKQQINDKEFMIRSFAAMGLGYKRNSEGFRVLLSIVEYETDPNVVAEAANSLANFGSQSLKHLVKLFEENSHWLVRQSILAVLGDLDCPEVTLKLCRLGSNGEDPIVRQAAIANLFRLAKTPLADDALKVLIKASLDNHADIRAASARVLRYFNNEQAQAALLMLRQDNDYRVVGAILEGLL
jgi:HEAT repeat protein